MRRQILLLLALILISGIVFTSSTTHAQDCIAPLNLEPGIFATMLGGVYIRANPDADAGIVAYAPERLAVRVIGGPTCADGQNWWQVERIYEVPVFKGWVAEGRPDRQFIFRNAPEAPDRPCPEPLAVPIGQAVQLFTGVRVRELPGLQGRVLTVAPAEATALVKDGPACNDNYNWWRVEVNVAGVLYSGWIVEGTPGGVDVAIYDPQIVNPDFEGLNALEIPCGPARPLNVGDRAIVRFDGSPLKNLRTAPTTYADVIFQLPSGIQMEILSSPVCFEGVNWRQVRVFGGNTAAEGWMAEGNWLGRFISADGDDYGHPAP